MTAETTAAVLDSLAAKIELLDLSDAEAAVLDAVLSRAAEAGAEVEGFGVLTDDGTIVLRQPVVIDQSGCAYRFAVGIGLDPTKVWSATKP